MQRNPRAAVICVALVAALASCSSTVSSAPSASPSVSPVPDLADRLAAAMFTATNERGDPEAPWVAAATDVAVVPAEWADDDDVALTATAKLSAAFVEMIGDSWDLPSQGGPVLEFTLQEVAEPPESPLCAQPAHASAEPDGNCWIEGLAGTDRIVHRMLGEECYASVLVSDEFTLTFKRSFLDDAGCSSLSFSPEVARELLAAVAGDLYPDHDWEADVVRRQYDFGRAGRFTVPANWDVATNAAGDALVATDPTGSSDDQTLFFQGGGTGTAEPDEYTPCEVLTERRAPATATQPARVVQVIHLATAWMVERDTVVIGLSDDRGGTRCEGPYGIAVGDAWTAMEVSLQYPVEDLPEFHEWIASERFEALAQEMLSVEVEPAN